MLRFLDYIPVRFKLALGHAVWIALLFSGSGYATYKLVEHNLSRSVDAALIASADSLLVARRSLSYRNPFNQSFLREFFGENYFRPYAQLVDLSGKVSEKTKNVRVSLPVTPRAARRAERGFTTLETLKKEGGVPLRLITKPVFRGRRFSGELIQVGAPLDSYYLTLKNIKLMFWVVLPMALALSLLSGYFVAAWSLSPVRAITKAAKKLGSDDLSIRLRLPKAKDELRELSATFNDMLDRLEDTFGRMKRFAGDVSHELRTPLTVLRGEAEFALRKQRSESDYRTALGVVASESKNMTQMVENLLLLARASSGHVPLDWQFCKLNTFGNDLCGQLASLAEEKHIDLIFYAGETLENKSVWLAKAYLEISLKNLLFKRS